MNPRIPADYHEVGRWLHGFATSHAKRESPRIEAVLDMAGPRTGESYGLRLVLGGLTRPPVGAPPFEFGYAEVADGRTRFAWCAAMAHGLRVEARTLLGQQEVTGRLA